MYLHTSPILPTKPAAENLQPVYDLTPVHRAQLTPSKGHTVHTHPCLFFTLLPHHMPGNGLCGPLTQLHPIANSNSSACMYPLPTQTPVHVCMHAPYAHTVACSLARKERENESGFAKAAVLRAHVGLLFPGIYFRCFNVFFRCFHAWSKTTQILFVYLSRCFHTQLIPRTVIHPQNS